MSKSIDEVTFSDMRCRYQTGRSIHISGVGRDKKFEYRNGVMTALGDIEQSKWMELAKELIERAGEQELYTSLHEWEAKHNYCGRTKAELEQHTLELHMGRFFDNPHWVDFVPFNSVYRPEILKQAKLTWVQCECCNRPGITTFEQVQAAYGIPPRICCPICGRYTSFEIISEPCEVISENG